MAEARVLLVDDEEDFTTALSERMESRGFEVDVRSSGPEAIEQVGRKVYDAVILDLAMPGMDGVETLRHLLESNPDLQVILLTGHGSVSRGVEAMREGAMEFLEKPADIEVLLDQVRKARTKRVVLSEKRSSGRTTSSVPPRWDPRARRSARWPVWNSPKHRTGSSSKHRTACASRCPSCPPSCPRSISRPG